MWWWTCCGLLSAVAWVSFVRPVAPLDFHVFAAAGRAVAHGLDPYPPPASAQVWSGSAFVYPWLAAWLFAPAAWVSGHAAALAMTALSCAAIAAGVSSVAGRRLVPFACVLFSAPTLDGLQMGTLNAVLFLGVCLAWRWRDQPVRAGVAVGVLVTLKLLCWPLLLWFLFTRRWAAATWTAVTGAVLVGAGWLFGPLGPISYARLLGQLAEHEVRTSAGLQGVLVRGGLPAAGAELIGVAVAVALVAVAARRGDGLAYGAAVVGALAASPVVWQHYYLLAAAPLLLVRNGALWYLLLGWLALSARSSYGISWRMLSATAAVAVLVIAGRALWRRRAALRRGAHLVARAPLGLVLAVALLGAAVAVGAAQLAAAAGPATVTVLASFTIVIIAWFRRRPVGDER